MIYKLFSYFIFIVLLFYFFLIFKYFSVKFSCICACIIHGSGRPKSIQGLGNPAEEEKECKSHRDGGHQEKEALKINMIKAPTNSQRAEQYGQRLHRSEPGPLHMLWLPLECFHGIPECVHEWFSDSFAFSCAHFLLCVCLV